MPEEAQGKLLVIAYSEPDYSGELGRFTAYVNPSEITTSFEIQYDSAQGSGTTNSRMEFKRIKPGDLTINFFLDGTGANGTKGDVATMVKNFKETVGYDGDIHRTRYLKVAWGTLDVRKVVVKSMSIVYKLFASDGVPLRAVITAVFSDNSEDKNRVAEAKDSSPDLTHVRVVKGGDTLPSLCNDIYGDPAYYVEVAKANRINNFRNIAPGTRIFFPPLEK